MYIIDCLKGSKRSNLSLTAHMGLQQQLPRGSDKHTTATDTSKSHNAIRLDAQLALRTAFILLSAFSANPYSP